MRRGALAVAGAALVLLGGCYSYRTTIMRERSTIEAEGALLAAGGPPRAVPIAEQLRWASDDWLAGQVREVGESVVVIAPYAPGEADSVVAVGPEVLVVTGDTVLARAALVPGTPVRALFDLSQGEPRVVGLEILSVDQALRLRSQLSDLPGSPVDEEPVSPAAARARPGWKT
jgi:hypothetical protein